MAKISVIGSGFSGLSAACFAAKAGHDVTVYEKNSAFGGRARSFSDQGFMFDMGPSWYWMPDIFESFFSQFGKNASDYYNLVQLDPGFQIIFGKDDILPLPASMEGIEEVFESIEKGSAVKLRKFLAEGKYKYDVGMKHLVNTPSYSWLEFAKPDVIKGVFRLDVFRSVKSHVADHFTDRRLRALMEFPVLFLGAMPDNIPALYSLMNYAALSLGTWYPMGGMVKIVEGMQQLATSLGVKFKANAAVDHVIVDGGKISGLHVNGSKELTDGLIASGDYNHMEQKLLPEQYRNYPAHYWDDKTFAPSCLIFYIGVNKKVKKLIHHNLFFDTSLDVHSKEIYEKPSWPSDPLFYVCAPSKTDPHVAPEGMENLFILIPVATGLKDTPEVREEYYHKVMKRMEMLCDDTIADHVVYKKSYCVNDFVNDYNAFKGNAYGLANTLRQTAVLKPTLRNKKIKNMFYAGQLTVPGPGVPPALISGRLAAEELIKNI
ncbi:MAG: phytoene desaturase [Flavipsychrobacter sp.]|nr:phytoene desaturase [Flavipsychrobacter sp.]